MLSGNFKEYSRRESNPNRRNRNPIFYPLNYGDLRCKVNIFFSLGHLFLPDFFDSPEIFAKFVG